MLASVKALLLASDSDEDDSSRKLELAQDPRTLEFVCLDERLAAVAEREGFPVVRG